MEHLIQGLHSPVRSVPVIFAVPLVICSLWCPSSWCISIMSCVYEFLAAKDFPVLATLLVACTSYIPDIADTLKTMRSSSLIHERLYRLLRCPACRDEVSSKLGHVGDSAQRCSHWSFGLHQGKLQQVSTDSNLDLGTWCCCLIVLGCCRISDVMWSIAPESLVYFSCAAVVVALVPLVTIVMAIA